MRPASFTAHQRRWQEDAGAYAPTGLVSSKDNDTACISASSC